MRSISPARFTFSRPRELWPRSPRTMRLSSTVPALSVSRASWPTSTWFIMDTCMYAAMLAAFSTGRRLATRSKARWSSKASDHDNQVCLLNEGDGIGSALSFTANRMVIGQQILRLLEGQALAPAGWSTNSYYLVIDSVLAFIFALVLASFLRLPYWYKRFERRSRYRFVRVSLRLLGELLLPTLILLGLPVLGGYSWPFI